MAQKDQNKPNKDKKASILATADYLSDCEGPKKLPSTGTLFLKKIQVKFPGNLISRFPCLRHIN